MRHQIRGRALGRTSAHKTALRRNLLSALFTHERIVTTVAKAKEFRPSAERMITLAKTKDLTRIRRAMAALPDKDVVKKLFDVLGPRFASRAGGYTRILKLGKARLGDNAPRAIFELVERTPKVQEGPAPEVETKEEPGHEGHGHGPGEHGKAAAKKPRKKAAAAAK